MTRPLRNCAGRALGLLRRLLHPARSDPGARYRQLFENVPDGVYESSPDGRILAANSALVRLLGFSSVEELRREINVEQLYVDPAQRRAFQRQLEENGSLQNVELELTRRDGRRIIVLENSHAVRDAQGRILYYQGTLTDISDRKSAELELRRTRDRALEASQLKSQFLANMSHELRTPLNAVVGMASLLVESPLDPRQRECAETVLHSARFLIDIIGELLDFSRIESGRLELEYGVFRLRRTVEEAASMLASRAASNHVEILCDIHPGIPELAAGDGARLQQVLTNLIGNAVKFTEHGEVVVTVCPADGGKTRFEVADTGIGIEPAALAIIFEPFRQADGSTTRKYGGTGLGLAIARQIVERMGGRLECASQPGTGSTFSFEIPLQPAPGCRPGGRISAPLLQGKRVLIQEPNARSRQLLERWVTGWGMILAEPGPPQSAFDVCIVAEAADGRLACRESNLQPCPAVASKCLRLVPFAQNIECGAGSGALVSCVSKPLRQLDLLENLMRMFEPVREGHMRGLLPLAEKVSDLPPRLRILAAEDNRVNQKVITRLIERLGHVAHVVSNGAEVLEAVKREPFDLILMDCQMPVMDGFAATAALRRESPPYNTIPIIALTASAVQGDREHCLAAGMDDYLSKPIVLEDLAVALDRWLPLARAAAGRPAAEAYPAIE